MAERDLIEPAGLPDRPWFRHTIYAPGLYTGYGVKTIPGVREAIDAGNFTRAAEQATIVIRALAARDEDALALTVVRTGCTEMAIDRQGTGLAIVRICIGVFFIFEGLGKIRWFVDSSILSGQLAGWMQNAAPGSIAHAYLDAHRDSVGRRVRASRAARRARARGSRCCSASGRRCSRSSRSSWR